MFVEFGSDRANPGAINGPSAMITLRQVSHPMDLIAKAIQCDRVPRDTKCVEVAKNMDPDLVIRLDPSAALA